MDHQLECPQLTQDNILTIIQGSKDLYCTGEQKSGDVQRPTYKFGWGERWESAQSHEELDSRLMS